MRLVKARVEGYRCVQDETVDLGSLTALVGSGGVGKSALLRAIDWCVNELPSEEEDLYRDPDGTSAERIVVTLHFADVGPAESETLGRYGIGDSTTISRSWAPGEEPKLSGSAYFYKPFDAVREQKGAARTRAYKELFLAEGEERGFPEPMATRIADVDSDMERFEREHTGPCGLCELRHLFGFAGGPRLRECFDYVFASADADAPDAFGSARDSTLTKLLASIGALDEVTQAKVDDLQSETQKKLSEIYGSARGTALKALAEEITGHVRDYVPDASVELSEELQTPSPPKPQPVVRIVHAGGYPTDVQRQGHGLQRTLVIAVLQALADALAANPEEAQSPARKSLMLSIEEPELYQHPLQARALAAALLELSADGESGAGRPQIAFSTHSEHFVRPALFEDLRVVRRSSGGDTAVAAADPQAVEDALEEVGLSDQETQVRNTLSVSLSQAVFAKAVVLCEGRTDAALLEAVANLDRSFEHDGIAVADCHGKSIIPVAIAILKELDISCFVLFDADRQIREKLEASDKGSEADRQAQIAVIAAKNEQLLKLCGEQAQEWPDRAVRDSCANFAGNVESDIPAIWSDLVTERDRIAREIGLRPKSAEVYRRAPQGAGQVPAFFVELLEKIRGL